MSVFTLRQFKKSTGPRLVNLSVSIREDQKQFLEQQQDKNQVNISEVFRSFIDSLIESEKTENKNEMKKEAK